MLHFLSILLQAAQRKCVFPFFAHGRRYTSCSEDGYCSTTRIYRGEQTVCEHPVPKPFVHKTLVRYRYPHMVVCEPQESGFREPLMVALIRVVKEPWLRQLRPGVIEVLKPQKEDPYYVECFYLHHEDNRIRIPVYKGRKLALNGNPTYETRNLKPSDSLTCGQQVPVYSELAHSEDALELFIPPGQATHLGTFDVMSIHTWRVKQYAAAGTWLIACRMDWKVVTWLDVTVDGYPNEAVIKPWHPELLSFDEKTMFECTSDNAAHVASAKMIFRHLSGPPLFHVSQPRFTLNQNWRPDSKDSISTYKCLVRKEEFEVETIVRTKLTNATLPTLILTPESELLPLGKRNHTFRCEVTGKRNFINGTIHLSVDSFTRVPGSTTFPTVSKAPSSQEITISFRDCAQLIVGCSYINGSTLRRIERIYKPKVKETVNPSHGCRPIRVQ
ncbi:unnamed protein product [Dicrocoelium dendriticum]|nr:unnamed protein product [Dicrocoelium dendriticum]